jgi:hypothetical protein
MLVNSCSCKDEEKEQEEQEDGFITFYSSPMMSASKGGTPVTELIDGKGNPVKTIVYDDILATCFVNDKPEPTKTIKEGGGLTLRGLLDEVTNTFKEDGINISFNLGQDGFITISGGCKQFFLKNGENSSDTVFDMIFKWPDTSNSTASFGRALSYAIETDSLFYINDTTGEMSGFKNESEIRISGSVGAIDLIESSFPFADSLLVSDLADSIDLFFPTGTVEFMPTTDKFFPSCYAVSFPQETYNKTMDFVYVYGNNLNSPTPPSAFNRIMIFNTTSQLEDEIGD